MAVEFPKNIELKDIASIPVIDLQVAIDLFEDRDMAIEMMKDYQQNYIFETLNQAHKAWKDQDVIQVEAASHKFKGSSGYLYLLIRKTGWSNAALSHSNSNKCLCKTIPRTTKKEALR